MPKVLQFRIRVHDWCMQLKTHINYWNAFIIQSICMCVPHDVPKRIPNDRMHSAGGFSMTHMGNEWMIQWIQNKNSPIEDITWSLRCGEYISSLFCALSFTIGSGFPYFSGDIARIQSNASSGLCFSNRVYLRCNGLHSWQSWKTYRVCRTMRRLAQEAPIRRYEVSIETMKTIWMEGWS